MTNLIIREWLNGGLIPLNVCVIFIISHSLWQSWRALGPGWTRSPGVASACAFWWLFVADLIRSIMAWSLLHAQNAGRPLQYLGFTTTMAYIAAASIATLATFRLIYTLSPDSWGHRGWISAAALVAAFMILLSVLY